jgi:hypothetical protein
MNRVVSPRFVVIMLVLELAWVGSRKGADEVRRSDRVHKRDTSLGRAELTVDSAAFHRDP